MFKNPFKKSKTKPISKSKATTPTHPLKTEEENIKVVGRNTQKLNAKKKDDKTFLEDYKKIYKTKKELLPKDTLTREELIKEIEKQLNIRVKSGDNPFKTRDDMGYVFFNSNMSISRPYVPFEEVIVGGKGYYVNKTFEDGKIIIEELYAKPDIEINLEEEYNNKESTKKRLNLINKQILYIKNQIAEGKSEYGLIDIEDLKEEKHNLERNLDSIKYGKSAIFIFQNPINNRKCYWLKIRNGEYHYFLL